MNTKNTRKKTIPLLLTLIIISLICWDFATVKKAAVVEGTFRYLKDFNAVTNVATDVAIVPSDYSELPVIKSRTSELTYEDVENMVRKAIELQGGIDGIIEKSDKVMMKVNLVGGYSPSGQGENTDVRVPKALVKIIHEAMEGDVELIIAEGTARKNDNPEENGSVWENSGYMDLLSDASLNDINFRLLNINQTYSDLQEVDLGNNGTGTPHNYKYQIHKEELEADVYISVPVLKIHEPGITNALKNQIGTAPGAYYGYNKMGGTQYYRGLVHADGIYEWTAEEIVDLSAISDIDFVVVDALMTLEYAKSYRGDNQVRMNTIVAGVDPVAVDHVCAKLFCLNPDDIDHITLAEKVGLGTNNPELINIKGTAINDVKKKVRKTYSLQGVFGQSNRTWILSKKFDGIDMSFEYITDEASIEPVAGENDWSEPVYFLDDMMDLLSFYDGASDMVSYAFTYFYSPEDKEAELMIGSHEDMIVYINAEEVYSYSGIRVGHGILDDTKKISIKEGENTLLVKTLNQYGDYTFSLNICDYESEEQYAGNRVKGLTFYAKISESTGIPGINSNQKTLLRNYPNPVTNSTHIEFELPYTSKTSVEIYDLDGRLISTLISDYLSAGYHNLEWNATNRNGNRVNSGIYLCTVKSKNFSNSIKIVVN